MLQWPYDIDRIKHFATGGREMRAHNNGSDKISFMSFIRTACEQTRISSRPSGFFGAAIRITVLHTKLARLFCVKKTYYHIFQPTLGARIVAKKFALMLDAATTKSTPQYDAVFNENEDV